MKRQTEKYVHQGKKIGFSRVMLDEAMNYDRIMKERYDLDRTKMKRVSFCVRVMKDPQ